MIIYNFRHRGPYEYDKFLLNFFQFSNDVVKFNEKMTIDSDLIKAKQAFDAFYNTAMANPKSNELSTLLLYINQGEN